ncbi:MAG: hypothetical protein QME81_17985 [bacterium]|nr:hypothetical protein [bacterium]
MVEENGSFVNFDKERWGKQNEENGRKLFINLFPGKKTQVLNPS